MATSVDAKLLKQTKFPAEFSQKVDMQKVNIEVMKKYVTGHTLLVVDNTCVDTVATDGSQVRYLRSLEMKTTLLSSFASICWREHAL